MSIADLKRANEVIALWKEAARDRSLSDGAFRALVATWDFSDPTEADLEWARNQLADLKRRNDE